MIIQLATDGMIQAITGKPIKIGRIDTICVHGHRSGGLKCVKAIKSEIEAQEVGIELVPLWRFI